jgi:Spy/CpxP family protein refolding chaperone
MKNVQKWFRSGGAIAPAFLMLAALAAFMVLAGAPAARAQDPVAGPEGPAFADVGGGDFDAELADAPDGPEGCEGCPMGMCGRGGCGMGGPGMGGMHRGMGGMQGMHGGGMGMGAGGGARHAEMMEKLKLTAQQKEKMADLREAQQRKMIGIRGGLEEARLDMRKLMRADAPNQAQIDATIDRMAKLRADAQKSRIATHIAMRGLLNESQRKTMDEMRGAGGGMGGGMHDGTGPGAQGGGKKRGA